MDSTHSGAPGWLIGLLVVFALAAAAVFGLFLYRHTELAALQEEHSTLSAQLPDLRKLAADTEAKVKPLDDLIAARKEQVATLAANEKTYIADVDRLIGANKAALAENDAAARKELATFQELMKEAPERRKELAREEDRAFVSERDADERRRTMREQVEKLSQEIEGLKKKGRHDNAEADSRIAELEGRVRQLTNEIDINSRELRSDGEVIASQAMDGFVVINRGIANNLRKGTKFTVFIQRAGKNVPKGAVQVVSVEERLATARILEERDPNDPLIVGDQIANPVYDPDKVKGFAIRGDFTRFSRDELKRFILDSGGRIDSELTTNTDYLVAGSSAQQSLDQAAKLGVSILSEDQLLDFVRLKRTDEAVRTVEFITGAAKAHRAFAFAGSFTAVDEGRIKSHLKSLGASTGGLGRDSAALIAGEGAERDMAKARELGVPVIDQSQFAFLATGKH